jgi:hypothetical protein
MLVRHLSLVSRESRVARLGLVCVYDTCIGNRLVSISHTYIPAMMYEYHAMTTMAVDGHGPVRYDINGRGATKATLPPPPHSKLARVECFCVHVSKGSEPPCLLVETNERSVQVVTLCPGCHSAANLHSPAQPSSAQPNPTGTVLSQHDVARRL